MEVGGQWVAISGSKLEEGGWISLSDRLDATNNFGSLDQKDQLSGSTHSPINLFSRFGSSPLPTPKMPPSDQNSPLHHKKPKGPTLRPGLGYLETPSTTKLPQPHCRLCHAHSPP